MHAGNAWGGSFDVARSPGAIDNDDHGEWRKSLDLDRAAMHATEETTQQSWLLHPGSEADNSKKKAGREIDLGCVVCSRKLFKSLMGALVVAFSIAGITALIVELLPHHRPPAPPEDNYTQALHKVLLFFNAQKSGKLPMRNNISWRGDSGLKDGLLESQDLAGGYYDAGDNIKFGFPGAFTITLLSWSVIEYRAKYEAIGEYKHVKELIKWGADYMLKTFNLSAPSIDLIWAQVGSGGVESNDTTPNDHSCWERPEDMDYPRHAYSCGQCSDLAAEMAAAMAAASIVFKNSHKYSSKLLTGANLLFDFSRRTRGRYSESVSEATRFYNSSGYWDEFVWGGAWMYYATGNSSYLKLSTTQGIANHAGASRRDQNYGVFNWDNKLPGAQVLLTRLRILLNPGYPYENLLSQYNNETDIVMCSYLPVYNIFNKTKGGLMQFNHGNPAPLQYSSAAAFLSALYADYLTVADIPGWNCGPTFYPSKILRDFARSQIDYILGDNPLKMSYVVGFGNKYPLHVHHRGASIPKGKSSHGCTTSYNYRNSKSPNPHTLTGAMVAGPDAKDRFIDMRTDFNYTEPTIAGNAMLAAALIALSSGDNVKVDRGTIFSNIPPLYPASPPPPSPWKP